MKKLSLLLACICILIQLTLPISNFVAKAEKGYTYACVLSSDVFLYQEEDDNSGLFLLPYTYYVKVITTGNPYSYVQYLEDSSSTKAVYGYCKTQQLTFVEYVPERPFLYYTLEVKYTLDGSSALVSNTLLTSIEVSCAYYGDYKIGSALYCYVYMEGKFGYVPKIDSINYEQNTDCFANSDSDSSVDSNEQKNNWKNIIPVAIIFLLCLILLAIFCFALKGKQPPIEKEE